MKKKILDVFKKYSHTDNFIKRPYIIAEAGVNHEGDLGIAKQLIEEAFEGGADAIKFQTYKADMLASKDSPAYWNTSKEPTKTQYELFKKYDVFWKKEMQELKNYSDSIGIEFLCTPFDKESAVFLNEMMDVFKISSSDITNKPFIKFLCDFGKPIILSTGASSINEIIEAVAWIEEKGNPLSLLHCVLSYPTADHDANLGMITDLISRFPDKPIGYSDHTLPGDMKVCELAVLLGSTIIEKHFTHDKSLDGNDHYHAMNKNDLKLFNKNIEQIFTILGEKVKRPVPCEITARNNARRSLVAATNIQKGATITHKHITWKRPAYGISPRDIDMLLGKKTSKAIDKDEVLQWSSFID